MPCVLVVDDEVGIAELLTAMLEDEGLAVVTAENGQAALERLAEHRFDLVLTDTSMPVMTGPELVSAMLANDQLRSVPVIALSAMPEAEVTPSYPVYTAFVGKPFRVPDLLRLVNRLLDRHPRPC